MNFNADICTSKEKEINYMQKATIAQKDLESEIQASINFKNDMSNIPI